MNARYIVINVMIQRDIIITTLMISSSSFWSEAPLQAYLEGSVLQIKIPPL